MSQLGQNRKSDNAIATSDLALKTDIKRTSGHVRKVPFADISRPVAEVGFAFKS
jgi:hypothetical protein